MGQGCNNLLESLKYFCDDFKTIIHFFEANLVWLYFVDKFWLFYS